MPPPNVCSHTTATIAAMRTASSMIHRPPAAARGTTISLSLVVAAGINTTASALATHRHAITTRASTSNGCTELVYEITLNEILPGYF